MDRDMEPAADSNGKRRIDRILALELARVWKTCHWTSSGPAGTNAWPSGSTSRCSAGWSRAAPTSRAPSVTAGPARA